MNATQPTVSQEEIARRAYERWEARGCPPGDGMEDWNAALEELTTHGKRNGTTQRGLRVWWSHFCRKIIGGDQ